MARVTVEDCILKVDNRFELVLMASKRAKDIEHGSQPTVSRDNDKPTILALREIADETISLDGLKELTKRSLVEEKAPFKQEKADLSENESEDDYSGDISEGDFEDADIEDFTEIEEADENFEVGE